MKILKVHDEYGWINAIVCSRWVEAKVYDESSIYGINNGRVSKLAISKTQFYNPTMAFSDQMEFNYDRGLDFDELPQGLLNKIVKELEGLPKIAH